MDIDATGISDQAMEIYTWITYGVVIQIFNLFGIVTNIINIVCFCRSGFGDSVNISLLGLSISDLGSLVTMTWICVGLTPAMSKADLTFIPAEVIFVTAALPHGSFTRISSCITAMITLERCLCITVPLKIKGLMTPTRTTAINVSFFVIFLTSNTPNYIANRLGLKYVPLRNKTMLGIVTTPDLETAETLSFIINSFSVPFGAFLIIVVCTTILSVQLRKSSQWRTKTITNSQSGNVSRRNYKAARMVVTVSTLFIVCFVPVSIGSLALAFVPEMSVMGKYLKISLLIGGLGYLMESVNSSINILIYHNMSSNYRDAFNKLIWN